MRFPTAGKLGISRLYHYQSFNADRLREVVVDGVIHFSSPGEFNDPWDCRPWFDYECLKDPKILEEHVQWYIDVTRNNRPGVTKRQVRESAARYRSNADLFAAKVREFSEAMGEAINERYRVYCLGTRPDCELMWAHYAFKHQGVCLEFDVRSELFYHALQVEYLRNYPNFRMTGFAGPDEELGPLLTKSDAWSYEGEFRLISDEQGDAKLTLVTVLEKMPLSARSLKAVILGCQATEATREIMADFIAASPQKPQLKTAKRMKHRFQLEIS